MADEHRRSFRQRHDSRPPTSGHPGGAPYRRPGGQTPPGDRPFPRGPRPDGGPRPFAGGPGRQPAEPLRTVRLRDGDREVEVSGDAAFVRAVLDELPTLLGRLAQPPASPRRADVTMPPPPPAAGAPAEDRAPRAQREAPPNASSRGDGRIAGANLEDRVLRVLRTADQPLSIAAIRERLGEPVSGQQVRRILERAPLVDASGDRPAAYSIR